MIPRKIAPGDQTLPFRRSYGRSLSAERLSTEVLWRFIRNDILAVRTMRLAPCKAAEVGVVSLL